MKRLLVVLFMVCLVKPVEASSFVVDEPLYRIAFGSCAFQSVPQPVFRAIADSEPDIYLSLGDAIYADYDLQTKTTFSVTAESLRREWQVLNNNPDWRYLVERVPVMATWDNHDYGHYQAGEEFELKEISKTIFLDFFDEPEDSKRRIRSGLYDAKIIGPEGRRVQIILLDTRSFKTKPVLAERDTGAKGSLGKFLPDDDPGASLLGEAQWNWLEDQLKQPAELRLLVSSTQVIADQKGMDEWGNYPNERQRLLDLTRRVDNSVVIMLSGNVHFAEVSQLDYDGKKLVDFTSSGLTHIDKRYAGVANPYRVAGPYTSNNFGMVTIDWNEDGMSQVTLSVHDESGRSAFSHTVDITAVQLKR